MLALIILIILVGGITAIFLGIRAMVRQNNTLKKKINELKVAYGCPLDTPHIEVDIIGGSVVPVGTECILIDNPVALTLIPIDGAGQLATNIEKRFIQDIQIKTEREVIEQGKSVLGRAVIGTLLLPGLGTIIGGMTGIGSKKKHGDRKTFMVINYLVGDELQGLTLLVAQKSLPHALVIRRDTLKFVVSGTYSFQQ